ncbi:hypothetical protein PUN28_007866 [Cardiocondyla obscurior]|uniref:Coiled-coil domain-containing protein 103 n=2 Tax=Cardiocondyla obscurior TaxID=286306 RepID=A0AAW2FV94_9HYME
MNTLKAPIDYRSLEEELHEALMADELYKLQNDAKIRAIEQAAPTYEHFRQMVNGAHLKPLDRNDMKPKIGVHWNPLINTAKSCDSSVSTTSGKLTCCKKNDVVNKSRETCEDFLQSWKVTVDSEKFIYVWNRRNDLQSHIFRTEIPATFLANFASVCLEHLSKVDDITSIIELLDILRTCNRFDLAMCFMTKDEKSTFEQLFQQLQKKSDKSSESKIKSLIIKYIVS